MRSAATRNTKSAQKPMQNTQVTLGLGGRGHLVNARLGPGGARDAVGAVGGEGSGRARLAADAVRGGGSARLAVLAAAACGVPVDRAREDTVLRGETAVEAQGKGSVSATYVVGVLIGKGSGSTRQRQCLSHVCRGSPHRKRQWKHKANAVSQPRVTWESSAEEAVDVSLEPTAEEALSHLPTVQSSQSVRFVTG